jgi:hypothetical protein
VSRFRCYKALPPRSAAFDFRITGAIGIKSPDPGPDFVGISPGDALASLDKNAMLIGPR